MTRPGKSAFTLLEVLISVAISMLLAGICFTAFQQVRLSSLRQQARISMSDRAQNIHQHLFRLLGGLQQSGAMALSATGGRFDIVFLGAMETLDGYDWSSQSPPNPSDLLWRLLRYDGRSLLLAENDPIRTFRIDKAFADGGRNNWDDCTFSLVPQPRRALTPATWRQELNSNAAFPDTTSTDWNRSRAHADDAGDWKNLLDNLRVVMAGMSDLHISWVMHDGSTLDMTPSTTWGTDKTIPGVWLDGRQDGSLAGRPKLLRMRFTLSETVSRTAMTSTFSFSFPLPGLAIQP